MSKQNPTPSATATSSAAPSATFRIKLEQPKPSDPTGALPELARTVAAYRLRNERMAIGLRCGFARLEHGRISNEELEATRRTIRGEEAERARIRAAERRS